MIRSAISRGLGNKLFDYPAAQAWLGWLGSQLKQEMFWFKYSPDRFFQSDHSTSKPLMPHLLRDRIWSRVSFVALSNSSKQCSAWPFHMSNGVGSTRSSIRYRSTCEMFSAPGLLKSLPEAWLRNISKSAPAMGKPHGFNIMLINYER